MRGHMPSIIHVRVFAIVSLVLTGLFSVPGAFSGPAEAALTWSGDRTISDNQAYTGETITLAGNLTITGSLTFNNVDLRIDSPARGTFRINVAAGGVFNVLAGSNIHSTNASLHFYFSVRANGTLNMNNSELHDCGWEYNEDWGLLVESDHVSITNSTLTNNCEGIIVDGGASPFIYNNNISQNDYNGIEVLSGSSPVIDHNIITGNVVLGNPTYYLTISGIMSRNSSPVITNNTVSGNKAYGICLYTSGSPVVEYNNITGHRRTASGSAGIDAHAVNAVISHNRIIGNDNGMRVGEGTCVVEENLLDNNTCSDDVYSAAVLEYSSSTYRNNTYRSSVNGVYLADPSLSTFENETIENCSQAGLYGLSTGFPVFDVVMTNCSLARNRFDVLLDTMQYFSCGGELRLVNPSYDKGRVCVLEPDSVLTVEWFMKVLVIFENGGRPADGAEVTVRDSKGSLPFHLTTGADGWTNARSFLEYVRTGPTTETYPPYNVSAEKAGKDNFTAGVQLASSRNVTVALDDAPPLLEINSPADGFIANTTSLKVGGRSEYRADLTVNGVIAPVDMSGRWTANVPLPEEGANTITAVALDRSLNRASASITVFRDTEAPVLMLTRPRDGFLTNRSTITVSGMSSDTEAAVTLNGEVTEADHDGSFSAAVNLSEGPNEIEVVCRDRAGNTAAVIVRGELDTVLPDLWILGPRDGLATSASSVTVNGMAEENAAITVNSHAAALVGTSFSALVYLEEGENRITVMARDRAGNACTVGLNVTRDSLPPALAVLSPKDGGVFNHSDVEAQGTVEPGATLTVNGIEVASSGTEFSCPVSLAAEGQNTILIEASDRLNNLARVTLTVYLDTVPPALKLKLPKNGLQTNLASVPLQGSTDPGAILSVNGREVNVERDGAFSSTVPLDREGANTISVMARDGAWNTAWANVTVYLDTVLHYNITAPKDGARVRTGSVMVTGDAEPGANVTVNDVKVVLRPDGAFNTSVPLVEGVNTILINISDRAGNSESVSMNVTRETASSPSKGFIGGFGATGLLAIMSLGAIIAAAGRRRRSLN